MSRRTLYWITGLAVMAGLVILLLILTRPYSSLPPAELTRSQAIQSALVEVCHDMTVMLYPEMTQLQVTTACFQEASALYQQQPDDVAYCYDTVKSDDLMLWGECFTEREIDFSGQYVDQERGAR